MRRFMRQFAILAAIITAAFTLSACDWSSDATAQQKESQTQQQTYTNLQKSQPATAMSYSPTRETINQWNKKWSEPGKLSYVYLTASNGQAMGYYVLKGLPVSYCVGLTPSYRFEEHDVGGAMGEVMVPGPSMDGAFYGGSDCSVRYGIDASTGQYIEFSVGSGINYRLYEQPINAPGVEPLGYTNVDGKSVTPTLP